MLLLITLGGGDGRSQARYRAQRAGGGCQGGGWGEMARQRGNAYMYTKRLFRRGSPVQDKARPEQWSSLKNEMA